MAGGHPETAGIGDLLQRLIEDTAEVARAEVELQRARIVAKLAQYRLAALFFAIAGTLGLAALVALLIGLILTLTPALGPGWATAVVCGIAFVVTVVLALLGRSQLVHLQRGE